MQSELNKLQAKLNNSDNTDYESEQHAYNAGYANGINDANYALDGDEIVGSLGGSGTQVVVGNDGHVSVTHGNQ